MEVALVALEQCNGESYQRVNEDVSKIYCLHLMVLKKMMKMQKQLMETMSQSMTQLMAPLPTWK